MQIGIPKEIKPYEGRVALIPSAAAELVAAGHAVHLQAGAGEASGYSDDDYKRVGVNISATAKALYENAALIVKIKEPIEAEYDFLRADHILFSFLHMAANVALAQALCRKKTTGVAFETLEENGALPLLAPMSEIAGRLAVYIGGQLLFGTAGGRGILLGGLPGAERGHVVVLGAGVAGSQAVRVASALGAKVTVFDQVRSKLIAMHELGANITALPPHAEDLQHAVEDADLLVGAVLLPGARAPKLVPEAWVRNMRPGSVVVDVAIDQGGCIETIRPTDYSNPTYVLDKVIHFGVTNIPGAVPRTASQMLSAILLPYCLRLADQRGLTDKIFQSAINTHQGKIVHAAVAEALESTNRTK